MLTLTAIMDALSRTYNDAYARVCPECKPQTQAPYCIEYCRSHGPYRA